MEEQNYMAWLYILLRPLAGTQSFGEMKLHKAPTLKGIRWLGPFQSSVRHRHVLGV